MQELVGSGLVEHRASLVDEDIYPKPAPCSAPARCPALGRHLRPLSLRGRPETRRSIGGRPHARGIRYSAGAWLLHRGLRLRQALLVLPWLPWF